jgi:hypothetical protein
MDIEIGDLSLIKKTEDSQTKIIKEIRNVYNINIDARRSVVEHRIPGYDGSILQDMGREPVRVSFEGEFLGENAKESMQDLWSKFRKGESISFSSDITGITDMTNVLIEELAIEDVGGMPNKFHYFVSLSEYTPPSQPEKGEAPNQDDQAKKEADKESNIDDIRGQVLDTKGYPAKGVTVKAKGPQGDYQTETDDQGYYLFEDVPDGKYKITVDEEGYKNQEKEVRVKKGGSEAAGGSEEEGEEGGGEDEGGGSDEDEGGGSGEDEET